MKLLPNIRHPSDLKKLSLDQLKTLAGEMRRRIIDVVGKSGGHLASNLGVIEITIALHYCFDFQKDRLLWDVGHQCYPHKLLTGRNERFDTLRKAGGLSGFPSPRESAFDLFDVGHAGTAIATALGMARADQILGRSRRGNVMRFIHHEQTEPGKEWRAWPGAARPRPHRIDDGGAEPEEVGQLLSSPAPPTCGRASHR